MLIYGIKAKCQTGNFRFFNQASGISSSNVKKIVQDAYGFIWLGTQDGLTRFDGIQATIFKRPILDGNDISSLFFDENSGYLWISFSRGGINAIDTKTLEVIFSLKRYSCYQQLTGTAIRSVYFDAFQKLWIGTENGLFILPAINKDTLLTIRDTTALDLKHTVIHIGRDTTGNTLAVLSGLGVIRFQQSNLSHYTINPFPGSNRTVYSCNFIKEQNRLVCSTLSGLITYNASDQSFLSPDKTFTRKMVLCALRVGERMLVSTFDGLFSVDSTAAHIERIRFENSEKADLSNVATDLFKDRQGNIWVGTMAGCYYAPAKPSPFFKVVRSVNGNPVNHLYYLYQASGKLLACDETGLYKLNNQSRTFEICDSNRIYYHFFKDPNNRIICCNRDGIYIWDDTKDRIAYPAQNVYPEFSALKNYVFTNSLSLGDSVIMLASNGSSGIMLWNINAKRIGHFDQTFKDKNKIGPVYALCKVGNQQVLITSGSYMLLFNTAKHTFKDISSRFKNMSYFFDVVKTGPYFYIATYGSGIMKTDGSFNIIQTYSTQTGLTNNCIYKLIPENDTVLWASTNNGLNRINLATGKVTGFYADNGLHGNEFEQFSGNRLENGDIAFGGLKGLTIIRPRLYKPDTDAPLAYITRMQVESKDGFQNLDTSNIELKKLYVPSSWLQITLSFAALNFTNPGKITYAYRIRERDTTWTTLLSNKITLLGLGPGNYTFEVKAANDEQIWSRIVRLDMFVAYKWYETIWFKLMVFASLIGLFYSIYRFRLAQINKQAQIRKDIAADLHDDLGSTLNSVKVFTHLAEMSAEKEQYFVEIKNSIREASAGLRDMIWVLDDKDDSMWMVIERVKQFALPVTEACGIALNIEVEPAALSVKLTKKQKRNILLILKEAINNSVKYAFCTSIRLSVRGLEGRFIICIEDNGRGFNGSQNTAGNGLKNMKLRAQYAGCTFAIQSSPGAGTQIIIRKSNSG